MIKYLRDKITGRPVDDFPLDENMPSIKKTHSQNSLNDIMSISTNSNSNDIIYNDRTTSQLEKLAAAGGGITSGRRVIGSTSPIIIPKKPPYSNASSQSSSSYTSAGDQMSSCGETLLQSHHESDDASFTSLPTLPSTNHQLEHSAARNRISVKKQRRQQQPPVKEKLSTLKETGDNQIDLFSSASTDEQTSSLPQIELQVQGQPAIDLSDLDTVRARLYSRDHSADKVLLTTPIVPTCISSIQRSRSFKGPQEIKLINRSTFKTQNDDDENESISRSSSEEHIYDNLDVFKRDKTNITLSNETQPSTNIVVKTREPSTLTASRLRPVTMLVSTSNDQQLVNEFANVFNQLKKRSPIKKAEPKEEIIPVLPPEEPVQPPPLSIYVEEIPVPLLVENESIAPNIISTNKIVETPSVTQPPNRRKTVGGVNLLANNKVAATDNKPAVSWIDIAKQKQSKFQPTSIEKEESEQQQTPSLEPTVVSRKQVTISSNVTKVKENTSEDIRSNRKSMFEPSMTRRASPSPAVTNPHAVERDSIRALKSGNPNRINNLIQFFDK